MSDLGLRALALGEVAPEEHAAALRAAYPDDPYTVDDARAMALGLRWACVLAHRYPCLRRLVEPRGWGDGNALAPLIVDGDLPDGVPNIVREQIDNLLSLEGESFGWEQRLLELSRRLRSFEVTPADVVEQTQVLETRRLWGLINRAVQDHQLGVEGWEDRKGRAMRALWNAISPPRPGGKLPEPAGVRGALDELTDDLLPRIHREQIGAADVEIKYRAVLPAWHPDRIAPSAAGELNRRYGSPSSTGEIAAAVCELSLLFDGDRVAGGDTEGLDLLARDLLVVATGASSKTVRSWTA